MRVLMAVMMVALSLAACSKKNDSDKQVPPVAGSAAVTAPEVHQQKAASNAPSDVRIQKPIPITPRKGDVVAKQQFVCKNGTEFVANFMRNPDQVEIIFTGRMPVLLPQEVMASGFSYATSQYKLLGKGRAARWIMTGRDPVDCVAR